MPDTCGVSFNPGVPTLAAHRNHLRNLNNTQDQHWCQVPPEILIWLSWGVVWVSESVKAPGNSHVQPRLRATSFIFHYPSRQTYGEDCGCFILLSTQLHPMPNWESYSSSWLSLKSLLSHIWLARSHLNSLSFPGKFLFYLPDHAAAWSTRHNSN